MTDESTTTDIRKFLKQVGITSQQQIEAALEQASQAGKLEGLSSITATMRLEVPGLDLVHTVESEISLP